MQQAVWQSAVYETTNVKIGAGNYRFTVSASKIAFDGFMSVYASEDDEKAENNVLAEARIDESTELSLEKLDEKQHFTQPPAHYTEASLVKTLEELGIGRPSTYSPTITTILARRYIVKENKNIVRDRTRRSGKSDHEGIFPDLSWMNISRQTWRACSTVSARELLTGKRL